MSDFSENESGADVHTLTKPRVKEPPFYQVVLLNDDYTTMEFVVMVIKKFFHKSDEEAGKIMMKVHHDGKGVCGVYPFEIAETKTMQVNEFALKNEFPLKCKMEKI